MGNHPVTYKYLDSHGNIVTARSTELAGRKAYGERSRHVTYNPRAGSFEVYTATWDFLGDLWPQD